MPLGIQILCTILFGGERWYTILPGIVETAKANGLDVFDYLNWLFRQITAANHHFTDEFLEKLMPWTEQAQENS